MFENILLPVRHRIKNSQPHRSVRIPDPHPPKPGRGRMVIFCLLFIHLLLPACTSTRYVTHTKKSGIEQLLVARALEIALQDADLEVQGARIFIEISSLLFEQNPYVRRALEHWFYKKGALLTDEKGKADTVASVLVKCAGTDGNEFAFGVPSLPVPLVNITTPQINIISWSVQEGCAEMEVILYSPDSGGKEKTVSMAGKSYFKKYVIILIPITSENIYKKEP